MMSGDPQPRRGGGGGGHKQVGIHKKPKRRRSSKIAKEKKSRLRRMFPLSSPSWGHSLLVLVLVLAAVVHAEDSYQPTTLPNISSREGGGTGAGVEEVADTSSGGGGPGGSGLPPRPLSSSANQQQQLKPCDRSRKVFTSPSGEISDGPTGTNYTQDSHCEWLIKARNDSQFITLTFHSMGTECSYDYIFVYDGDSFRSPLLGSFSGKTEPQQVIATSGSNNIYPPPTLLFWTESGMLILLYSDTNYVLEGFKAKFSVSNCPNNCSGHGKCVGHRCVCHGDWVGYDCNRHACPEHCGLASGRGVCREEHCSCQTGHTGQSCSLKDVDPVGNEWHWISDTFEGLSPRAAHSASYVPETDSLYVFGGYDLNNVLGTLQVYRFRRHRWEDEWGMRIRNPQTNIHDKDLLEAVLGDDESAFEWGLSKQNLFKQYLYVGLNSQYQPVDKSKAHNDTLGSYIQDSLTDNSRPLPRYGHSAQTVRSGFILYGGKFGNGSLSNELWFYNAATKEWSLRAVESRLRPPALTRHTLTVVVKKRKEEKQNDKKEVEEEEEEEMQQEDEEILYLFGGSRADGMFSSKLYRIQLNWKDPSTEQWEEIQPRGGKELDVRIVAHTTNYHEPSNSLIVYGGVVAGVARFSRLSDRLFAFQLDNRHWTEIMYPRTPLRDAYTPRERAFHTTTLIGNYMIVFGGYSHRHNKEEICYDNQMYLYHLGCHTWINSDVLGTATEKSSYPKVQGVFAHAAAVRKNNALLIVGGYHGNVNGDLLAYTLPSMLVIKEGLKHDPELLCVNHNTVTECLADPECGWCSADGVCYGRTVGSNCTTNLQTTRCPGICPALGDCHACLIHGSERSKGGDTANSPSVALKLGLGQCSWCVQNARCHFKDDNYGVCGEETPSQGPGWWGAKGTEVLSADMCSALDRRPGLTFLKYLHPVNWTMPDNVAIVNATMVDFNAPTTATHMEYTLRGEMIARLWGFIHPAKNWDVASDVLLICTTNSKAELVLSWSESGGEGRQNVVQSMTNNCSPAKWPAKFDVEQRIQVDFQARREVGPNATYPHPHSKMGLEHNGTNENSRAFTFEYLEPYSSERNGSASAGAVCETYRNCLHCLSDAACGWCDLTDKCLSRTVNESLECAKVEEDGSRDWKYLLLQPSHCANCSNFIGCEQCVEEGSWCEWWAEDARCARRGRAAKRRAVQKVEQCPVACHERSNCSACLDERGRCVWCEATQQCFSFSVYTSEYQFGLCREWLDQTLPSLGSSRLNSVDEDEEEEENAEEKERELKQLFPDLRSKQQCKSCEGLSNCSTCLKSLSCGWCFDRDNPIDGRCMRGDFNRSTESCARALNTTEAEAEWAYAQCPDVDECGLGLHDCHKEAKCTNTHGSYNCHCRRGFVGDGRTACERTCYEACVHGLCDGAPNYQCKCKLGWTGADCSINCGCNNHSTCLDEVGKCDRCQEWTEGEFCERCKPGSFGNATSPEGCRPCDCNGHGNEALGYCDGRTGECFCQDNTEGMRCEFCNIEFYGDPMDGGHCYFQCEARGMLTHVGRQGFGSLQSHRSIWGGPETKECLWIIQPKTQQGTFLNDSLIQLTIEKKELNVSCEDNSVYVYDGRPDLSGYAQQSQLLAVFCSEDSQQATIQARTTHLTVYYKQGPSGQGFNAMYNILSCSSGTCDSRHVCNERGECICPDGFIGPDCSIERCPRNCSAAMSQGVCDDNYGRCICAKGFAGKDCSIVLTEKSLQSAQLFNSRTLTEQFKHLRKTLPRFGHSLFIDKRSNLWMFGGYSLSNGPLNDIRQFDTKNNTWMQITVDSPTPEDKMPQGRYFHGAEIVYSAQAIYIYGGLTSGSGNSSYKNKILGDFWKFGLQSQRWEIVEIPVEKVKPPSLAGHTLTRVKFNEKESLILIGGISATKGIQNEIWEYSLESMEWERLSANGAGPIGIYGHSTVYHIQSKALYVFGGVEFVGNRTRISNKMYALQYNKMTWSELPPFSEINRKENNLPRARFLHSAVTTENYMLIFGGRTEPFNSTDLLVAYVYKCNFWIRLTEDSDIVGLLPPPTYAQAMTIDRDSKAIYVTGGWDGTAQSRVTRFTLPPDLCQLYSRGKYLCRHYMGCSYCSVDNGNEQHCFASGRSEVCQTKEGGKLSINEGETCNEEWLSKRRCTSFKTCTECLASWPSHQEKTPICQWCEDCNGKGSCSPAGMECQVKGDGCKDSGEGGGSATGSSGSSSTSGEREDKPHEEKQKITAVGLLEQCSSLNCAATDCESCMALSLCAWVSTGSGSESEMHDCVPMESVDNERMKVSLTCPVRCRVHQNCTSCLTAKSSEGGWSTCRWSTLLNECLSPSYQPLYCTGGVCGLVLSEKDQQSCPEPCSSYVQCETCLRHAHCGWCAREAVDGEGICTEGSLESPSEYPAAATCPIIYALRKNVTLEEDEVVRWHYVRCPAENECTNGHHTCDPVSQTCVDANVGFQCTCAEGYKEENGQCIPTCKQGCVRGLCVKPNVCECHFGYVGENCSIQCQCNGHSDCDGPDKLDVCLECHNNTMGAQCDRCLPFFVGDPKNSGECVPCFEYCNSHSELCIGRNAENMSRNMTKHDLTTVLKEGPLSDAVCLRCENRTDGDRCETCIHGHFRGTENHKDACRPCQCHGHGDTCDAVTGEKCNCGNNTESDNTCSASSSKNSAQQCYSVQCTKCKELYLGYPIDGHQCYKTISAESKMCFDAKTIDECKKPAPLKPGQVVFFVIQPRYMNVDIRIIIDVTQGDVDFFMSPQDDSFVVMTNKSTNTHQVYLDPRYSWVRELGAEIVHPLYISPKYEYYDGSGTSITASSASASNVSLTPEEKLYWTPRIENCKSLSGTGFYVKDKVAQDLSTYITLDQCNTLLRVFGLKNRLVLTLPQGAHNLTTTRFYMALRANQGPTASYGLVFFRQDQSHIDLFVFFSVFFSCFFLFLAVCVVIWKAKQAADIRRARRRQFVEMLHMAKRPFAVISVLINEYSQFCVTPLQGRRNRSRIKAHNLSVVSSGSTVEPLTGGIVPSGGGGGGASGGTSGLAGAGSGGSSLPEIRMVALEPTADNLAAVATVFVRLPGKFRTPVGLVLGSTLITMPRLSSVGNNRMLRRRRNSYHTVHFQHQAAGGNNNAQPGHQVHPMQ